MTTDTVKLACAIYINRPPFLTKYILTKKSSFNQKKLVNGGCKFSYRTSCITTRVLKEFPKQQPQKSQLLPFHPSQLGPVDSIRIVSTSTHNRLPSVGGTPGIQLWERPVFRDNRDDVCARSEERLKTPQSSNSQGSEIVIQLWLE